MKKIRWELEEAIALFDLYLNNKDYRGISTDEIDRLTQVYRKRAEKLGIDIDDKFRNAAGLRMQLGCIHYVVTDGAEGMSNASKLFYQTYEIYRNEPSTFNKILRQFYEKYGR